MAQNLAHFLKKRVRKLQVSNLLYFRWKFKQRRLIKWRPSILAPEPSFLLLYSGLGAAPGFLSGDNEADILEVYQRYKLYRALAEQEEGPGGEAAECGELCPAGAHCAWGLCFCDPGMWIIFIQPSFHGNMWSVE